MSYEQNINQKIRRKSLGAIGGATTSRINAPQIDNTWEVAMAGTAKTAPVVHIGENSPEQIFGHDS
jgi:hypothetical protein